MELLPYSGRGLPLENLIRGATREPFSEVYEPSVETLESLEEQMFEMQGELRDTSVYDKLEAIAAVGKLWENSNNERRMKLQNILPETTGYHPNMIDFELMAIPEILKGKELAEYLDNPMCFYGGGKVLDGYVEVAEGQHVIANPRGPVFIIGAGNSTVPPVYSMLISLLTNNFTILRPSFANYAGLYEIMKSFEDAENSSNVSSDVKDILRKMSNASVVSYMSHDSKAYEYLLKEADLGAVNFWGGGPALSVIKRMMAENPNNPKLIINGPLTGVAVVDGNYTKDDQTKTAKGLAFDTILYRQQLCNSPTEAHFIGSYEDAKGFGEIFSHMLDEHDKSLPGELSEAQIYNTQVIRRSLKRAGSKVFMPDDGTARWTVVVSKDQSNIDNVTNNSNHFSIYQRPVFLEIVAVPELDGSLTKIEELPHRKCYQGVEKAQTVGYAMDERSAKDFAKELSKIGIYRVVPVGQMYYRTAYEPSDGEYLARELTFLSYFK